MVRWREYFWGLFGSFLMAVGLSAAGARAAEGETQIVVNTVPLTVETVQALQRIYPVPIRPGRYWYDAFSGAWGQEGGPIAGQMMPGLRLGGPLRADASRGTSGVYINGRQLTLGEKAYLEQSCQTPVRPARYWVNAYGIGGFEGAPPSFNLALCGGGQTRGGGGGGGSSTRTFCDPDGSCRSSGLWGSILTVPR
ncbi:MAG TPA: hypothetical protein VLB72_16350 [Burkholderiales bacterium]|nr:hypothetical protein [Burkholderiales bacterium]